MPRNNHYYKKNKRKPQQEAERTAEMGKSRVTAPQNQSSRLGGHVNPRSAPVQPVTQTPVNQSVGPETSRIPVQKLGGIADSRWADKKPASSVPNIHASTTDVKHDEGSINKILPRHGGLVSDQEDGVHLPEYVPTSGSKVPSGLDGSRWANSGDPAGNSEQSAPKIKKGPPAGLGASRYAPVKNVPKDANKSSTVSQASRGEQHNHHGSKGANKDERDLVSNPDVSNGNADGTSHSADDFASLPLQTISKSTPQTPHDEPAPTSGQPSEAVADTAKVSSVSHAQAHCPPCEENFGSTGDSFMTFRDDDQGYASTPDTHSEVSEEEEEEKMQSQTHQGNYNGGIPINREWLPDTNNPVREITRELKAKCHLNPTAGETFEEDQSRFKIPIHQGIKEARVKIPMVESNPTSIAPEVGILETTAKESQGQDNTKDKACLQGSEASTPVPKPSSPDTSIASSLISTQPAIEEPSICLSLSETNPNSFAPATDGQGKQTLENSKSAGLKEEHTIIAKDQKPKSTIPYVGLSGSRWSNDVEPTPAKATRAKADSKEACPQHLSESLHRQQLGTSAGSKPSASVLQGQPEGFQNAKQPVPSNRGNSQSSSAPKHVSAPAELPLPKLQSPPPVADMDSEALQRHIDAITEASLVAGDRYSRPSKMRRAQVVTDRDPDKPQYPTYGHGARESLGLIRSTQRDVTVAYGHPQNPRASSVQYTGPNQVIASQPHFAQGGRIIPRAPRAMAEGITAPGPPISPGYLVCSPKISTSQEIAPQTIAAIRPSSRSSNGNVQRSSIRVSPKLVTKNISAPTRPLSPTAPAFSPPHRPLSPKAASFSPPRQPLSPTAPSFSPSARPLSATAADFSPPTVTAKLHQSNSPRKLDSKKCVSDRLADTAERSSIRIQPTQDVRAENMTNEEVKRGKMMVANQKKPIEVKSQEGQPANTTSASSAPSCQELENQKALKNFGGLQASIYSSTDVRDKASKPTVVPTTMKRGQDLQDSLIKRCGGLQTSAYASVDMAIKVPKSIQERPQKVTLPDDTRQKRGNMGASSGRSFLRPDTVSEFVSVSSAKLDDQQNSRQKESGPKESPHVEPLRLDPASASPPTSTNKTTTHEKLLKAHGGLQGSIYAITKKETLASMLESPVSEMLENALPSKSALPAESKNQDASIVESGDPLSPSASTHAASKKRDAAPLPTSAVSEVTQVESPRDQTLPEEVKVRNSLLKQHGDLIASMYATPKSQGLQSIPALPEVSMAFEKTLGLSAVEPSADKRSADQVLVSIDAISSPIQANISQEESARKSPEDIELVDAQQAELPTTSNQDQTSLQTSPSLQASSGNADQATDEKEEETAPSCVTANIIDDQQQSFDLHYDPSTKSVTDEELNAKSESADTKPVSEPTSACFDVVSQTLSPTEPEIPVQGSMEPEINLTETKLAPDSHRYAEDINQVQETPGTLDIAFEPENTEAPIKFSEQGNNDTIDLAMESDTTIESLPLDSASVTTDPLSTHLPQPSPTLDDQVDLGNTFMADEGLKKISESSPLSEKAVVAHNQIETDSRASKTSPHPTPSVKVRKLGEAEVLLDLEMVTKLAVKKVKRVAPPAASNLSPIMEELESGSVTFDQPSSVSQNELASSSSIDLEASNEDIQTHGLSSIESVSNDVSNSELLSEQGPADQRKVHQDVPVPIHEAQAHWFDNYRNILLFLLILLVGFGGGRFLFGNQSHRVPFEVVTVKYIAPEYPPPFPHSAISFPAPTYTPSSMNNFVSQGAANPELVIRKKFRGALDDVPTPTYATSVPTKSERTATVLSPPVGILLTPAPTPARTLRRPWDIVLPEPKPKPLPKLSNTSVWVRSIMQPYKILRAMAIDEYHILTRGSQAQLQKPSQPRNSRQTSSTGSSRSRSSRKVFSSMKSLLSMTETVFVAPSGNSTFGEPWNRAPLWL